MLGYSAMADMENSWQSKCGSLWQQLPPPPPLVASSSHGSRTQLRHESMSLICETIQEHMPSNLHDLKNLDHAHLGAPLFSFLSGPPAHVPCDRQHLLYPKPVPPSSQVSLRTGNGVSAGSRVSVLPSALWPPNVDCQNLISGEVLPSPMSANSTMNCSNSSDVLQAANLNFQKLQAVACQNPHEKDKVKSFSSLIRNNNASPIPSNNWKLQKYADITALQKVPLECNVSAYPHGHNPSSSFPRVFCSGISGNLFLSGTGLLGVVCTCHGLYMSISKFSEHSGSCDFDPGSAVRMDNGEAIAQWWKTFFSKSGIRVLEGHRRWDWPEGISAASGSTDHPITNMSNNFGLWNENDSFRTSLSYEQQNYSVLNSKENQSCRNSVDEYAYHEKDRTSQECSNSIFKYIINSSHGNLQHPADKQLWGIPNSFGMNTEKASHSTTAKLDSVCGSANSLPALPNIQDLKTPFIGFGVRRNTSFIVERPGVSSNIELRLGQPEQSQTLETKVIPSFESHLNGMQAEPPKVFLSDKLLQKSNELQGSKWTIQNADIASNPTERRGPTQLEHSSHVGGAYGATTDRKNSSSGNFKMTDLNPPFLSFFKNPETKWQFRNIYDNDNDNHVTEKLHYESHAPQSEKICFPWSRVAGNIKEFHTDVSNGQNDINKGKKMDYAVNGLLDAAKSNTEFSNTFKEDLRNSVFVQNATPTLSKENFRGVNPGLQDENMQMPAVQNMVELSNRNNEPASVRNVQWCEIRKNPCIQSLMTIAPSISKDHVPLLNSSMMPRIPDIGEKSTLPGTICWMAHTNERFGTMTGRSSSAGASDLPPVEQFFLRPGGIECNFTLSKREPSSQGLSYAYVPEKRISAVQANCLTGKYGTNGDYYCNLAKGAKNGAATSSFHSKLNENCFFLKERTKCLEKTQDLVPPNFKSAESHSFQWRDVPKKIMESCSSTRKEQQAGSFKASLGSPAADVFKCFTGCARNAVPLKEHEISNISSRCSAPDVTQSSIEVNKKDSSIVEGGDIRCANNLVVEEGSGNDRSWSSDDALDNELCAEFSGSASKINLIKRGPLNVFPREPSISLIEEIRLQNSLKSKYAPYQIKRSSTFQEESDHLQKFEVGSKKRRKTVKWMKLDAPFSASGQSSINNESPKCTEEVGQNAHSNWDMQMPVGFDHGSPSNCADSFEQGLKQRNTALSAVKGISLKRDLKRVYLEGESETTEAHKSSEIDDTLETFETFRKKSLKLDDASATRKGTREICCSSAEFTAKLTSLGGPSSSQGKPNFPKWMARPMVVGKYGIISNGNPSKPTKIFPLWKILKTPASHAEKSNRNAYDNDKQKSLSVKVKETSVRRVKETALSKKVLRSQVKKVGTHNLPHIEPEPRDPNGEMETASCSATNESDDLSYTSLKCNNHGITDSKPGVQLKRKYKEGRKRSLHELLIKGNDFKVANSSVMKNSISLCQTTNRCWEELTEDAVDGRVEKNEMNNAKRCSEKHQRVYWSSEKDECDLLFECNRFLIKGLQSEGEAVGKESVSFRGTCVLHATSHMFMPEGDKSLQPGEKFMTCARTEGYKGRKREGFLHNNPKDVNGNAGCLVPQEQLNAWLHIHRQKPQRKGRPKLSSPIVDSDCRKAYARYKQSKGWKHLVVYKSGIHALGLYTSQFISRGAMVVEYVGEIVGLRVADRRENEYHSGKKLQHKSACYFFRIDKEHIIDATRKGGIARFVNHSCQPNCVARVISVRNEKKVIFFAERDIYPGEEITYDYHFNHEDEGEKIACYCNSKNCRRFLN